MHDINNPIPNTVLLYYLCLYLYVNVRREKKRKKVKTLFLNKRFFIVPYKLFE
jgi:hypothetical protein